MTRTAEEVESSIAERVARLQEALGSPFEKDGRLQAYAMALKAADAHRPGSQRPRLGFLLRADEFLAAHEIAVAIVSTSSPRRGQDLLFSQASWLFNVESIRRGHVRTVTRLKSLETAFFTEWNELPAAETNEFWAQIGEQSLQYKRRDLMAEILEAGRIATREHYDFAVDMMSEVDPSRASNLAHLISKYESQG